MILGEAVDVAKFFAKFWLPTKDDKGKARPGLLSASRADKPGAKGRAAMLTSKLGDEILELRRAAQDAHTAYLLSIDGREVDDPLARGRFLVSEMNATLTWLFDDGVEDRSDAQLARIVDAHASDPMSSDALASELEDYATLSAMHAAEFDGLAGFDVAFIDEARAVALALLNRPAVAQATTPAVRDALELRNRVLSLLQDRMAVRAAARLVFRDEPAIVREATSVYERRRRTKRAAAPARRRPRPRPRRPPRRLRPLERTQRRPAGGGDPAWLAVLLSATSRPRHRAVPSPPTTNDGRGRRS